jgi:hypothetical protein
MPNNRIANGVFILISVAGMVVLGLSMRHGPGIGGDATIYIFSARNLLDGHGLGLLGPRGEFRLIPYFPPMYPLLLAGIGIFGLDMVRGAWWLNLLLFGGILWLIGTVTYRVSRSFLFSAGAALLVLASPVLIPVYSWAMSEPLAIFLGLGGLALLLTSLEQPGQKWLFYISALAVGLSFLTRYSAVAYLITGCILVFLFLQRPFRQRLGESVHYLSMGLLPMLIWMPIDLRHTSTVASRSLETIESMASRLADFLPQLRDVILFWLVPDSWIANPPYPALINTALIVCVVLGLAAWVIIAIRRLSASSRQDEVGNFVRLVAMLTIFSLAYLLITALVYITTFPPITIASRMLSPLHVAMLWLAVLLAGWSYKRLPGRGLREGLLLVVLLGLGWYAWRSARIVQQNYDTGLGYLSPVWQQSETMQAVRALHEDTLIVTNEQTAVLFLADRPSYPLAEIYLDQPLDVFKPYGEGDLSGDDGQSAFRYDGAALVLFDSLGNQLDPIYHQRAQERAASLVKGLRRAFQGEDGAIYFYPTQ